jgi:hypothetical protein
VKLHSRASRPLLPIPLSVLLTLLWVGLVRLFFLWVTAQAVGVRHGRVWAARLLDERVLGSARLPTIIVASSLLLLVYLWLDYRSRPEQGWRTVVFLVAAGLLVYLSWAVWHSWWSHLAVPVQPGDMLMTALPARVARLAAD